MAPPSTKCCGGAYKRSACAQWQLPTHNGRGRERPIPAISFSPIADFRSLRQPLLMKLIRTLSVLALIVPATAQSQAIGKRSASTCLDLRESNITVTGVLKLRRLQGASHGSNGAFIVELPDVDCVDHDSSAPVGDSDMLVDVRVTTADGGVLKSLTAMVGRKVTIAGPARLGQIEPDGAPLVIMAARVDPAAN